MALVVPVKLLCLSTSFSRQFVDHSCVKFFIEAARLWFLSDLANSSRPWEISNIWWTSVAEIFFSLQGLCVLLFYSLNIKQGFIISLEAGKSQSFSGRLLRLKFCFFFLIFSASAFLSTLVRLVARLATLAGSSTGKLTSFSSLVNSAIHSC